MKRSELVAILQTMPDVEIALADWNEGWMRPTILKQEDVRLRENVATLQGTVAAQCIVLGDDS